MDTDEISLYGMEAADMDQNELKDLYLVFSMDGQYYGVPIAYVVQITGMKDIIQMPELPEYVPGIIDLGGIVAPIVDVRLCFKKEKTRYSDHTSIIITSIGEQRMGFIVESVEEVSKITADLISAPPQFHQAGGVTNYLTGVARKDGRIILLLNMDRFADESRKNA